MKTMKKSILSAAVAATLGFGSAAQAGVIIDLFADPAPGQSVSVSNVGQTASSQTAQNPAQTIGGFRDLNITKTEGLAALPSAMTAVGGFLFLSNETGNKSIGTVTWDGSNVVGDNTSNVNTSGLGGIDLTTGGATAFLADIIAADLGFDYKIRVWDMDGDLSTLSAGVQIPVQPGDGVKGDFLFDWFNLGTGSYCDGVPSGPPPTCLDPANDLAFSIVGVANSIDFTRIGAFQIEFSNPATISVDFAIGTIQAVPEPGSLALGGIGLLAAALSVRRRKSAQA